MSLQSPTGPCHHCDNPWSSRLPHTSRFNSFCTTTTRAHTHTPICGPIRPFFLASLIESFQNGQVHYLVFLQILLVSTRALPSCTTNKFYGLSLFLRVLHHLGSRSLSLSKHKQNLIYIQLAHLFRTFFDPSHSSKAIYSPVLLDYAASCTAPRHYYSELISPCPICLVRFYTTDPSRFTDMQLFAKQILVDQHGKATNFRLYSLKDPHMRALHLVSS